MNDTYNSHYCSSLSVDSENRHTLFIYVCESVASAHRIVKDFPLGRLLATIMLMNNDANNMDLQAYDQAIDYLYGLINFEMRRHDRYMASKLDASRPHRLMEFLGNPHREFPSIHIAGTKGKGSVAAICAASLQAAGYRVGLYTSPHVQEFRERIRILTPDDPDGRIPPADFVRLMDRLKTAVAAVEDITWFEVVTAIAFLHFAQQKVDVAVVEVGLGGRLDATNVVTPLVSVITRLSFDHTDLLGNTLSQIAWEKGGIIKPGIPVVTAPQQLEAQNKLVEIAVERESPISIVGQNWKFEGRKQELVITRSPSDFCPHPSAFPLALVGDHQVENGAVAVAALATVQPQLPNLTLDAVRTGLATVQWNGRLQTLHESPATPTILLDCAHNVDSAIRLRHALTHDYQYEKLWLIFGASAGKDVAGMLTELLPLAAGAVATISTHPRADAPEDIVRLAAQAGYTMTANPDLTQAVSQTWQKAGPHDLICVTGSIFVVGDLLNQWENLQSILLFPGIADNKTAVSE
ncbi:MAG: bifunctional folylpolyglutamate synthase/dihydrofolate synthase [Ardenticatenaceae bacterium]|nr:bifunctional folylpolyglutamate synthase/dihydrofolate synthase [Ardenticatenaceae bacterium]MCB9446218.1 bifunctional folylpolyglutamate synthase/dihydrofolate synthase [Ardenticatenaceae bacterium]